MVRTLKPCRVMEWSNEQRISPLKVGQYKLNSIIGKGNFSVVKLATHLPTGTKVAIKMIEKCFLNGNSRQQMLQEISILKILNHPNIIKLYQVMQTSKLIYLVMEYASGGEVYDHIVAHGRMNEREARTKFKQIVSGMVQLKQLNVVHRDLKAENLLLDKDFNIKIADFGFSVICQPGQMLFTHCGSPPYAAPEIFKGAEYEGCVVDIWSLGVMLYVMTVGKLPFAGNNLEELKENINKGIYKIPFFMSTVCKDLISRLLCCNPQQRIKLAGVLKHKWMHLDGEDHKFDALIQQYPTTASYSKEVTINPYIIAIMQKMSYSKDSVLMSLLGRKFDDNWATYHILHDKFNKETPRPLQKPPSPPLIIEEETDGKIDNSKTIPILTVHPPSNESTIQDLSSEPLSTLMSTLKPTQTQTATLALPANDFEHKNGDFPTLETLAKEFSLRRHSYDNNPLLMDILNEKKCGVKESCDGSGLQIENNLKYAKNNEQDCDKTTNTYSKGLKNTTLKLIIGLREKDNINKKPIDKTLKEYLFLRTKFGKLVGKPGTSIEGLRVTRGNQCKSEKEDKKIKEQPEAPSLLPPPPISNLQTVKNAVYPDGKQYNRKGSFQDYTNNHHLMADHENIFTSF